MRRSLVALVVLALCSGCTQIYCAVRAIAGNTGTEVYRNSCEHVPPDSARTIGSTP